MNILEKFQLKDRVALITGGNRGLGKAIAHALAEAGGHIALTSRDAERAQNAAAEIAADTKQMCRGYACDVTNPKAVETVVSQVVNDFEQIDILVNIAGGSAGNGAFLDRCLEVVDHVPPDRRVEGEPGKNSG